MKKNRLIIAFLIGCIGLLVGVGVLLYQSYDSMKHVKIESLTITFFDGRDAWIGELLLVDGDIVHPRYELRLSGEQTAPLQEALSKASKHKEDRLHPCNCIAGGVNRYKITINDELELYSDGRSYLWTQTPFCLYEADAFAAEVDRLVTEYLVQNVYIDLSEKEIACVIYEGVERKPEEAVRKKWRNYTFSQVAISPKYDGLGQICGRIVFEDQTSLALFSEMGSYGYLSGDGFEYYVTIGQGSSRSIKSLLSEVYGKKDSDAH